MQCDEFIRNYTDYLDDGIAVEVRHGFEEHLAECLPCRRYHRVIQGGLELCRGMPEVESSPHFQPRLIHRLYHLDDAGRLGEHHYLGSAALVAVAAVGFLALAWLPFATRMQVEVTLPAVAVEAPIRAAPTAGAPALFRPDPFAERRPGAWNADFESFADRTADFFDPSILEGGGNELDALTDLAAEASR